MEFQFQLIAQIFILFYTHPDFFCEKNDICVWDVSVTLNNLQSVPWILTNCQLLYFWSTHVGCSYQLNYLENSIQYSKCLNGKPCLALDSTLPWKNGKTLFGVSLVLSDAKLARPLLGYVGCSRFYCSYLASYEQNRL